MLTMFVYRLRLEPKNVSGVLGFAASCDLPTSCPSKSFVMPG